ncbi:putative lipoprotein [Synechococcus sp. BIOS-E4-1]|uniref:hypothetical protein n=1 Tax=Synechococcus sp. BIOS-E4-1 TaxID=1400864 RepID=UPI0016448A38|nr:hypothetical protein [Synechococcus sp. BIOS-E4-1]QNI56174.1 putative lipoprotein [Synechococcus sp. BIOS-E4-1]
MSEQMIKRLPVILFALGLAGCSYPSEQKAKEACDKWRNRHAAVTIVSFRDEQPLKPVDRGQELGMILKEIEEEDLSAYRDADRFRAETKAFQVDFYEELVQEDREGRELIEHEVIARWCREDSVNKQILGYENKKIITKVWQNKQGAKGRGEAIKRFRY